MKRKIAIKIYNLAVFLFVLFALALISILFLLGFSPNETYTIYKNECEIKPSNIVETHDCWMTCINISSDMLNKCGSERTGFYMGSDLTDYCDRNCGRVEKEVCNKVEVDEINILNCSNITEITQNCYFNSPVYGNYCEQKNERITDEIYCEKNISISKKDITKEWLDENCELKRCTPCEDLECKNQKCDLYYCFEKYEVEVK